MRDVGDLDYGGSSGGLYSRREVGEYVCGVELTGFAE